MTPDYLVTLISESPALYEVKAGFTYLDQSIIVGAVNLNKDIAIRKTYSEFYERLLPFIKSEKISRYLVRELSLKNRGILKFYFNSFEYDEFYGIEVKGVCSGDTIILPAEFIFLRFRQQYSGKEQFNFIDATGLACHENEQLAIQNGVCELIERDQLASMWYKIPSKVIEIENNEDFICEAQKKIVFSMGFRAKIFLTENTFDNKLFTAIAYLINKNGNVCFGSATCFAISLAVEKAIYEALMLRSSMALNEADQTNLSYGAVKRVYADSKEVLDYLHNKANRRRVSDLEKPISSCFQIIDELINKFGCEPFFFKYSNPFNSLVVCRTFIPTALNKYSIYDGKFNSDSEDLNSTIEFPFG